MPLKNGSRLGPYQIVSLLGMGGIGEVYRARDSRLDRDVALKVLLPHVVEDASFRARFHQEARAVAALNHPNIVTIHDVGENYLVSELVDGVTLRGAGPQPVRRALEMVAQVADGLAAAHEIGIVHRDVKPENIMITREGRAKILDFGIAKRTAAAAAAPADAALRTEPGMVVGTPSYMSPEQVRGGGVDSRSDLFSLGLVLHEMLSGQRAFTGESPTEVMSSILRDDPAPLPGSVPPPVAFVISHCLEKEPGQRFQSARDLAASLRALAVASHSAAAVVEPPPRPRRGPWRRGLSGAAVLFALAGAAAAGWFFSRTSLPSFHQVTFQRGFVSAARFAAGGKMLVYSAQWNAGALDLYSAEAAAPESRPFGLHGAHLFSTSVKDELAIGLDIRIEGDNSQSGTLAVVPLNGGAPRPLLQDVAEAAWHPEGNELAVVRATGGVQRLEFPPGKVLHQTGGWLANVRFSPGGDRIAFSEHPFYYDDRGWVATVDLAGNAAVVSQPWESIRGLAWSGGEIWYAASESGLASSIHAARPGGGARVVARFPGGIRVEDVRSDGALLLSTLDDDRAEMFARLAGEARDRPLDWLGPSYPADLSADGKLLLFSQYGRAGGGNYAVYLRKMDGSAPVRLGEGDAAALSPDGQWALAVLYTSPQRLVLLPTGVGSPRTLAAPDLVHQQSARWLPDSRRFLIAAGKPGRAAQLWLHDIGGGAPRAVSPEGVWFEGDAVSPDGQSIAATSPDGVLRLYSLTGGESRDIPGVSAADRFVRWRPGGRSILVSTRGALPIRLFDLDLADGERKPWSELQPADATGITEITQVMVSADGSTIVYGQNRKIRTLYLVQGLR